jgi:hypothetical protein
MGIEDNRANEIGVTELNSDLANGSWIAYDHMKKPNIATGTAAARGATLEAKRILGVEIKAASTL